MQKKPLCNNNNDAVQLSIDHKPNLKSEKDRIEQLGGKIKFDGCCSSHCKEIYSLPIDDQKKLRKGKKNSNKIFKKGRFNQKVF